MSGSEPTKRATSGVAAKVDRGDGRPVLLVPTAAQLARGERLIDADPATYPQAVRLAVDKARKAGFEVRVTYSQFQAVPPVSGRNRGLWIETHAMCVRVSRETTRGWGCWFGTDAGWSYDDGQWKIAFLPHPVNVTATEFTGLITGAMVIGYKVETGKYCAEKVVEAREPGLVLS